MVARERGRFKLHIAMDGKEYGLGFRVMDGVTPEELTLYMQDLMLAAEDVLRDEYDIEIDILGRTKQ